MSPAPASQEGPPSVRSAVIKFALGGLAATIVLAGVTALALARISRAEAVKDARRLTELVGRQIVEPRLDDGVLDGNRRALLRFDGVIRTHVLKGDFVRVKLWTPEGRIAYSDRSELIGARYGLGDDERRALRDGHVASDVSDLSKPENRFERHAGELLEVYLPVRTGSGRPALFEAYLRLSSVVASGRDLWGSFIPALVGALVVLQLVQLPLARSLARRVQRAHRDREALLKRALDASDLERRRIAADLHDGTVQELVAASYAVASARESLDGGTEEQAGALGRAEQTCRNAIRQLRSLLIDIYPPRLREAGLASALRDLLASAERSGVETSLEAPAELTVPDEATTLLYRAAQEAVRNAAAHGKARHIGIELGGYNGRVSLEVTDDGQGFSVEEQRARPSEGHFGLRLLADQARDAGGTLEVESSPGAGTRLRMEVPAE